MVQKTPLKGRTVAITRPTGQAEEAGALIKAMGGVPYYIPAIEIKGLSNPAPIKNFISELGQGKVDYVILMSTNGVKYLFEAAEDQKLTNQLKTGLGKAFVIAVGPRTAEALTQQHVRVDMVPTKYSSEGLLESLQNKELSGKSVWVPRTSNASPTLADGLQARGAEVVEIYVYESNLPADQELKSRFYEDLAAGKIDAIVFGSGLSAKNIFRLLSEMAPMASLRGIIKKNVTTVAIGPTTAEALASMDVPVDVVPQNYIFEEALKALSKFWTHSPPKQT